MTEQFKLPPDNIDNGIQIAEENKIEVSKEPYIVTSIIFGLSVLAIMNIVFGPNATIYLVSTLAGFMAWLILTAINPKMNHNFLCTYTGLLGILLNTNSSYLKSAYDGQYAKDYLIILVFVILGAIYGNLAYRFSKETKDVESLIYFILFSSFIVRGIFLIKTGF